MAHRADAAPINRIPYVAMAHKVKGLAALPQANNCQDSTEKAQPVGLASTRTSPSSWMAARGRKDHAPASWKPIEQKRRRLTDAVVRARADLRARPLAVAG